MFKVYKDDLKEWANGDKKEQVKEAAAEGPAANVCVLRMLLQR